MSTACKQMNTCDPQWKSGPAPCKILSLDIATKIKMGKVLAQMFYPLRLPRYALKFECTCGAPFSLKVSLGFLPHLSQATEVKREVMLPSQNSRSAQAHLCCCV